MAGRDHLVHPVRGRCDRSGQPVLLRRDADRGDPQHHLQHDRALRSWRGDHIVHRTRRSGVGNAAGDLRSRRRRAGIRGGTAGGRVDGGVVRSRMQNAECRIEN